MLKIVLLFVASLGILNASGGETTFADSDFIPRVVNFLIFVGILYYLVADGAKKFFKHRREGIANELEIVQDRLKKSAKEKESAKDELEAAKKKAGEIIQTAKKEATIILKNSEALLEDELKSIERQYKDMITLEKRKTEREVVSGIVDEIYEESSKDIDKDNYVDIVLKKVA